MPTPAYIPLDPNAPSGPTQSPDAYAASDLLNVRALRDAIVTGVAQGWTFNGASDTDMYWSSGALTLRLYMNAAQNPTQIIWYWSNDGNATFVVMQTSNLTWTASGRIATVDNGAGAWVMWLSAYMRAIGNAASSAAHAALVGTAVHGLGTMSTQNANAVAITGGTVNNAILSQNQFQYVYRLFPVAVADLVSGVAWNWGIAGVQFNMAAGGAIPNIVGPQTGEIKRIWVTTAGPITIGSGGGVTFAWATGHPVWNAAGGTLVCCVAIAGNFVLGTTIP